MYICPVCGYNKLRRPADDFLICPSCGTQFGYTDANRDLDQLRDRWLSRGLWYSQRIPEPSNWNPIRQLENLGHIITTPTRNTIETRQEPSIFLGNIWQIIPGNVSFRLSNA